MNDPRARLLAAAALAAISPLAPGQFNPQSPLNLPGGFRAQAVQIADQSQDGNPDLVFGATSGLVDRIYMRTGPTFPSNVVLQTYPASGIGDIEVAQLNGGNLDVASTHALPIASPVVRIKRWGPNTLHVLALPPSFSPHKVKSADLDGDKLLDVVTAGRGNIRPAFARNLGPTTFGAMTLVANMHVFPSRPSALGVGDFNHDCKTDVIVPRIDGAVSYFRNTTVGTAIDFAPAQTTVNPGTSPYDVCVNDFNGDGWLDYATANAGGSTSVFLNQGPPSGPIWNTVNFTVTTYAVGPPATLPLSITCNDFDCDGDVDLALALQGTNQVRTMANNGVGVFKVWATHAVNAQPRDIDSGLINENGHFDAVTANYNGSPSTLSRLHNTAIQPLKWHIYLGGYPDSFSSGTPTGVEDACPRPGAFTTFVTPRRQFDQASCTRKFGHTFPWVAAGYQLPPRIMRATLSGRIRADCASSLNDTIGLGYRPAGNKLVARKKILSLPGVTTYSASTIVELDQIELGSLPGGINLLPKLNAERLLDVFFENGTAVDDLHLQLWTCARDVRCTFQMTQQAFQAGTTWNTFASFAPANSWVFWFFSTTVDAGLLTPAGQMCLRLPMWNLGIAFAPAGNATIGVPMPSTFPGPCWTLSTQAISINFGTLQWCLSNTWTGQLFN